MGLGIYPGIILTANGNDISSIVEGRLIDIVLTDTVGMESDFLEIRLTDTDPLNPLELPPTGAELELSIGYDGQLVPMGLFVCDEVELAGWPSEMTIRARAAVYKKSKAGKADLQTQKSRSWPSGTKLGDLVKKIAAEHGLEPKIAESLASIELPHTDQTDESDLNLLIRLAKKYDAIVKPADGKLILAQRGKAKSVSGESLGSVTVSPSMVTNYRMIISNRETAGMVVAYWHAVRSAKRNEVKVGAGEPVRRLRNYYPSQEMALAAARSELQRRQRGQQTIAMTVVGKPNILAEAEMELSGFRPDVDGTWLISRVTHKISASTGYICDVECEKPNASEEAEIAQEED